LRIVVPAKPKRVSVLAGLGSLFGEMKNVGKAMLR